MTTFYKVLLRFLVGLNILAAICAAGVIVAVVAGLALGLLGDAFGTLFVTEFTVHNATEHAIMVTPIGTAGRPGGKCPIPVVNGPKDASLADRRALLAVGPKQTLTFHFDWDDVNLSELVVENQFGRRGQLIIDPEPTVNQYSPPPMASITVNDAGSWLALTPDVQAAYEAAVRPPSVVRGSLRLAALLGVLLVPFVSLRFLLRLDRRLEAATARGC